MDDKPPLKGAWSWSRDPFLILLGPSYISGVTRARVVGFCIQVHYQVLPLG